jgi:hypothetical protein
MPRWEALHPEFVAALEKLAARDVTNAEAWRLLIPVAKRVGLPRPSYWMVRRRLIDERRLRELRRRDRDELRERVVDPLLIGRAPRL